MNTKPSVIFKKNKEKGKRKKKKWSCNTLKYVISIGRMQQLKCGKDRKKKKKMKGGVAQHVLNAVCTEKASRRSDPV